MTKLLIVDDDPAIRESLALGLGDFFEVDQAAGGAEALRQMEIQAPDLILLDQSMKGLSGTCVLECLGSRQSGAAVVIFSATMNLALARQALKLGALDCISKPFSLEALRTRLEALSKGRVGSHAARKPFCGRVAELVDTTAELDCDKSLEERKRSFTRELFNEALADADGDVKRAAHRLGLDASSFSMAYRNFNGGASLPEPSLRLAVGQ